MEQTLSIKELAQEFIRYLEGASCSGVRDPSSPFELPLTAKTLAQLEVALCQAKATDEQVVLLTNGTPARALIAGLILHDTGLTIRGIVTDLTDKMVEALCECLSRLKQSGLLLLEASSIRFPKPGDSNVRYMMAS